MSQTQFSLQSVKERVFGCFIEWSAEFVVALRMCLCIAVWKRERLAQWMLTFSSRSVCICVCVCVSVCETVSQTVQADKCLC